MKDFIKATPRPWVPRPDFPNQIRVKTPNRWVVVGTFHNRHDADMTIEAVNSYDANRALIAELVEALDRVSIGLTCRAYDGQDNAHYCPNCDNTTFNLRAEVRAAITKAKEAMKDD